MTETTPLTWFDLSKLQAGARVEFVHDVDIFPECIVPKGTRGTIRENGLNEIWCALAVLPDDQTIRDILREWQGCVCLTSHYLVPGDISDDAWYDDSPLREI